MRLWWAWIACAGFFVAIPGDAGDVQTAETLGWDYDAVEIRTEKVADGLYVLFGLGGNIAVSVGEQGVLIVDDMFPELHPKIVAAIEAVGGKGGVDFAINTHWHFDHAQGNLAFGPAGAWIVAQSNSRDMLIKGGMIDSVGMQLRQDPYPRDAQAVISFDEAIRFHLNGGDIRLLHAGPAHTAGDTAVIFEQSNAVHMGDVFNHSGYPFIDAGNGGGVDGMIAFCKAVLAEVGPKGIVIPGHGEIVDGRALASYIAMLETVRQRVAKGIAQGKSLSEIIASKPTADFDAEFKKQSDPDGFVDRVYTSLAR